MSINMHIILLLTLLQLLRPSFQRSENIKIPFHQYREVHFDLTEIGTTYLKNAQESLITALRQVAHTKALMVLHYREEAELTKRINTGYEMSVTLNFLNCSQMDFEPVGLRSEEYTITDNMVQLTDYDCTSDELRQWCAEDPKRWFRANYTLEKRFGYTMEMQFFCYESLDYGDPAFTVARFVKMHWMCLFSGLLLALVFCCVVFNCRRAKRKRSVPVHFTARTDNVRIDAAAERILENSENQSSTSAR